MQFAVAGLCIACLLLGIAIGYFLSRKQQGEPVMEIGPPKPVKAEESILADPFTRALYTEEELSGPQRIPTMQE